MPTGICVDAPHLMTATSDAAEQVMRIFDADVLGNSHRMQPGVVRESVVPMATHADPFQYSRS